MLRASALACAGVKLLRLVPSLKENASDAKHMLSLFRGMTTRAVSLSVACGEDPLLSVLVSEAGRGILAGDGQRIAMLEASQPRLARRFSELRDGFETLEPIQRRQVYGGSILKKPGPTSRRRTAAPRAPFRDQAAARA